MSRLINILFFILLSITNFVNAEELHVEFDKYYVYLINPDLSVQEIAKSEFLPFRNDLNQGLKSGSVWVKLELPAINLSDSQRAKYLPLTLRVGNYTLKSINLYQQIDGKWTEQSSGYSQVDHTTECLDDRHCFTLNSQLREREIIYIKIVTRNLLNIHLEIVPKNKLTQEVVKRSNQIWSSVAVGSTLLLLAVLLFIVYRSKLLIPFFIFELLIVISLFTINGDFHSKYDGIAFLRLDIWPQFAFQVRLIAFGFLCFSVLNRFNPKVEYNTNNLWLLIFATLNMLILLAGYLSLSVIFNIVLYFFAIVNNFYGLYKCRKLSRNIFIVIFIGFAVHLTIYIISVLKIAGFLDFLGGNSFSFNLYDPRFNGVPVSLFIFSILFFELLADRNMEIEAANQAKFDLKALELLNIKLNEKGSLIELLAHEIKNPLTTINFASNAIQNINSEDKSLKEKVFSIKRSVSRINQVIDQIYLSHRLDNFVNEESKESVDLDELINLLVDDYDMDSIFQIHIVGNLKVKLNRFLLTTILNNLITNAVKYSKLNSKIRIECETSSFIENNLDEVLSSIKEREKLIFKISNFVRGSIIPEENKLFTKYYRHENNSSVPGMGIGLNIVQVAANLLNGSVYQSLDGDEITFTLEVPV